MRVLIIVGNEPNHYHDVQSFRRFLKNYFFKSETKVKLVLTAYLSTKDVLREIASFLKTDVSEQHILLYRGHGQPLKIGTGWWLNSMHRLDYELLVAYFLQYSVPLLWINACCHSGGAIPALDSIKDNLSKSFGFLGSSSLDEQEFGNGFLFELVSVLQRAEYLCEGARFENDISYITGTYAQIKGGKIFKSRRYVSDEVYRYHVVRWGEWLDNFLFPRVAHVKNTHKKKHIYLQHKTPH